MSYDEPLVGALAIVIAIIAGAISAGPWESPYQLRTFAAITRRYGKHVARGVWMAIAVASFAAGLAIINGVRPSYAVPAQPGLQPSVQHRMLER